jgi:hypothetical protein
MFCKTDADRRHTPRRTRPRSAQGVYCNLSAMDVLECPKCHGRLRVVAVITEREPVRRILAHLGLPTHAPPTARARDPTDDDGASAQLALGLA